MTASPLKVQRLATGYRLRKWKLGIPELKQHDENMVSESEAQPRPSGGDANETEQSKKIMRINVIIVPIMRIILTTILFLFGCPYQILVRRENTAFQKKTFLAFIHSNSFKNSFKRETGLLKFEASNNLKGGRWLLGTLASSCGVPRR